jgi:hypothetical protein
MMRIVENPGNAAEHKKCNNDQTTQELLTHQKTTRSATTPSPALETQRALLQIIASGASSS